MMNDQQIVEMYLLLVTRHLDAVAEITALKLKLADLGFQLSLCMPEPAKKFIN